jgi:copper(I)-binding protein
MTITGGEEADALMGVSVDSSVAMMAEVHETSMDDEGMMAMQEVSAIDIPAEAEVKLEPGGFHVMLMQLAAPLENGDEFTVTLEFENAGEMEVDVTVQDG